MIEPCMTMATGMLCPGLAIAQGAGQMVGGLAGGGQGGQGGQGMLIATAMLCPQLAMMTKFGDDGGERPNVKEMAFLQAICDHEREIRQKMGKHFNSVKTEMEVLFKQMDKDGNGLLSMEEVQKMCQENELKWGKVEEEIFAKMDVDKDGKVSLEEFLKWA